MPQALAARYAAALVDAVLDPASGLGYEDAWFQLRAFEDALNTSPDLKNVLLSPAVPVNRKRAVVKDLAELLGLHRLIRNFLFVLLDRRRLTLLTEARQAFELIVDERLGIVRAEVRSAAPLSGEQEQVLASEFGRLTGKQVRIDFRVDPLLLGGVVAKIGSTVYDGSVRAQLEALRGRLVSQ
ncbi:MAG TPA: ATP synthase F1 subunit delta [Bryobacteraceae bacterium]|nr:ATP synthase F1 subunit delta [Bryobacteraceae bacterium]